MNQNYNYFTSSTHPGSDLSRTQIPIGSCFLEASIVLPTGKQISLGTLTTVSISKHRETFPVTKMSRTKPTQFTRGHALVAGTLVFSVFKDSSFMSLIDPLDAPVGFGDRTDQQKQQNEKLAFFNMSPDELPPFDIHMVYVRPDNVVCYEGLKGVHIVDEGSVRTIDVPAIQESYSYMAVDRIPLQELYHVLSPPTVKQQSVIGNPYLQELANILPVVFNLTSGALFNGN